MTLIIRVKFNLRTRLARKGLFILLPINSKYDSEVRLFRSVLDKALYDCLSKNKKERDEALEWLNVDNPDFVEVCTLAMFDPDFVYEKFYVYMKLVEDADEAPIQVIQIEE